MPAQFKIPKCNLAQAYYAWCDDTPKRKDVHREEMFAEKIRCALRLRNANDDIRPIPTSRETWRQWTKKPPCDCATLSFDQAVALKAVTGCDVTTEQALSDEHNFSTLVTMVGEPYAKRAVNRPDEDGNDLFDISVDRIAFRPSLPVRVMKSVVTNGVLPKQDFDIGSATLVLRAAHLHVEAAGKVTPLVTELAPGGDAPVRAVGITLSDDPTQPGTWTARPDKDHLEGSVFLSPFAQAECAEDAEITVAVTADEAAIEADFRPTGEDLSKDEAKSRARKHLMDKVLALDVAEQSRSLLLSRAIVRK